MYTEAYLCNVNHNIHVSYEEVCGNLMISQQLEPICQPINNTFCMQHSIYLYLSSCSSAIIQIRKQHEKEHFPANRMVPATILNVRHTRVKTLFFMHYQNQCNSYGHSKRRLFIVRFPAAHDRYPGFATGFWYFMAWQFERGAASFIRLDMRVSFLL